MLLAEEFASVPVAKAALSRLFPDSDIDRMVEEQPLLLVEDIELALSEMKRCAAHLVASRHCSLVGQDRVGVFRV